jgi:UDP-N-acetylmuramyl pentapeptide phosphotransferase/UDP-N-acetylglucosamine-1-phosphate transferase
MDDDFFKLKEVFMKVQEILWLIYSIIAFFIGGILFYLLSLISKSTKIPFDIIGIIATLILAIIAMTNSESMVDGNARLLYMLLFIIPFEISLVNERYVEEEEEKRKREYDKIP